VSYVATARNPKGQRLARVRLESYLIPALGTVPLRDLTGDDARRYRLYLEQHGRLRPYTVTHVLSDLRCLLRWATSTGLLARSPFPPRVLPRIPETAPRGFGDRELATLMAAAGRMGFVLRLLLGTGLRWAEACRATRDDVRGRILEVAHTKSGRLRRVPLTRALLAEIATREHRLVPYATGSPGSFSRSVRKRTGIANFHVHRCRHTFAMRWLAADGNLAVLQMILGHRDLSTTMRYARVTDALIGQEAAEVEARLTIGVLEDSDDEPGVRRGE
jgi:integrase